MNFEIEGKVAFITGGASGIGLSIVKDLLRNGAKGVAIADIDFTLGQKIVRALGDEFEPRRAIFIQTDVTSQEEFESALKKTVDEFRFLDILINNAGVHNHPSWEKEIEINVNGVIRGTLLGVENYLQKYRQGQEAVVVNISSIAGLLPYPVEPVYSATKFAVMGASCSWGASGHYERTKVKVVTICPSFTHTAIVSKYAKGLFGEDYQKLSATIEEYKTWQSAEDVSRETVKVIKRAKTGTAWIVAGGQPAYQYILPALKSMEKNTI